MDVPVDRGALVEPRVGVGTKDGAQAGRDEDVDDRVEGYCEEDLVDVQR